MFYDQFQPSLEPELVWLVDDQPLRPSADFRLQYDGQNAKLEIHDAQPDDTGTYAVRITNEYGVKETNAKLVVQAGKLSLDTALF